MSKLISKKLYSRINGTEESNSKSASTSINSIVLFVSRFKISTEEDSKNQHLVEQVVAIINSTNSREEIGIWTSYSPITTKEEI